MLGAQIRHPKAHIREMRRRSSQHPRDATILYGCPEKGYTLEALTRAESSDTRSLRPGRTNALFAKPR